MFAIEVEFLMGRATISQWDDRTQAEWPPHPQRLFSSLVAAHGELDEGAKRERALRWLERLPPPEIKADLLPSIRTSPSYFVPVNDEVIKFEKGRTDLRHILDRRNRQERFFPSVVPSDPVVVFQWTEANGVEEHREALKALVESLTYLGHSSSPVRACLRDERIDPSLRPTNNGNVSIRVPGSGRFDRLVTTYQLRMENESLQPPLGRTQTYGQPTAEMRSVFSSDALVAVFDNGPKLGLDSTLPLMQHMRNALLARLGASAPEVISGHDAAGNMSKEPHLVIAPLGFVDSKYADGSLKGAAFVLPIGASDAARRRLRSALCEPWLLHLGPLGSIAVRMIEGSVDELKSLNFSSYTQASRTWSSVTPVILDRHPKKRGPTVEGIIARACERVGLPTPLEITTSPVSGVSGVPHASEFHGRSKQVDQRIRQHVLIRFESAVRGPVILGAGRFMGLGLCKSVQVSKL